MSAPGRSRAGVLGIGLADVSVWFPDIAKHFWRALAVEVDGRRFFLWLPVAAMGGVALNLAADSEPVLWLPALLALGFAAAAFATRRRPLARGVFLALLALSSGFLAMSLRTERVSAPVIDRIRIASLEGVVEELDPRLTGARFILRITNPGDWPAPTPERVRLTTKTDVAFGAGDRISLKARLPPPAHAVIPAATILRATPSSPASARSARRSAR